MLSSTGYPQAHSLVVPLTYLVARVALLQKKLDTPDHDISHEDLVRLVRQLDHMTLAISQAAAQINQRASRMTVLKYFQGLARSNHDRARLLQKDLGDPRRMDKHRTRSWRRGICRSSISGRRRNQQHGYWR